MNIDMTKDAPLKYTFSKIGDKKNTTFSILGTSEILIRGFVSEKLGQSEGWDFGSSIEHYNQGSALFKKIEKSPKLLKKLQQGLYSFGDIVPTIPEFLKKKPLEMVSTAFPLTISESLKREPMQIISTNSGLFLKREPLRAIPTISGLFFNSEPSRAISKISGYIKRCPFGIMHLK